MLHTGSIVKFGVDPSEKNHSINDETRNATSQYSIRFLISVKISSDAKVLYIGIYTTQICRYFTLVLDSHKICDWEKRVNFMFVDKKSFTFVGGFTLVGGFTFVEKKRVTFVGKFYFYERFTFEGVTA